MSSAARIEELQKKFDENPRRYFAPLANECRKAGDLEAAIAICRAHLPQQPGHMSGHIVYGQALFEAGELGEARTVFETALGLDPENLIALRHMGDIAARTGDREAARQWYTRVLETDPRNEEIQGLLAGLDSPPAAGAGVEEPATGAPVPEEIPTVTAGGDVEAGEARDLPTLIDPALVAAAAEAVPVQPAPADLLDFEPTSFTPPPIDIPSDVSLGVEMAPEFEVSEAPRVAPDFALDGFEATSFEPPPREPAAAPASLASESPVQPPALPPLDFDATGFGATGLEPTGLVIPSEPAAPAADAFVTETMAELYLQQGYPDRALDVYRQLVAQNPDDAGLRERMARVEREGRSVATEAFATEEVDSEAPREHGAEFVTPAAPTIPGLPTAMEPALVAAAADAVAPRRASGPTIRQFLVALATGQAVEPPSVAVVEPGDLAAEVAAAPAPGGEIATVVDVVEEAPSSDALDQLFGPAHVASDVLAADTLAEAFASVTVHPEPAAAPEPNPLAGKPARPAGNDLSLDHVFGQPRQQGASRPTGNFSFDQFFSEGAVRAPRDEAPAPKQKSGDEDDIEEFNSWLKGLKNQ